MSWFEKGMRMMFPRYIVGKRSVGEPWTHCGTFSSRGDAEAYIQQAEADASMDRISVYSVFTEAEWEKREPR